MNCETLWITRRMAVLTCAGLLAGCAATRSTFDVQSAPLAAQAPATAFVKITELRDLRQFEAAPRNPSTPSLQDPNEIKNPAITSRAIARKRGGYGNAMADILLPEGRTVQQLVREGVTRAVSQKGYAVVDERSPDYANALPLQVDIQQFWAWFTPGFWQISLEFEGILVLRSEVLIGDKADRVRGYAILKGMAATDDEWKEVLTMGMADLETQIKVLVKPPR